ncbi:MAG TPA: hypothetical protein VGG85_09530 [Terracidiphilus sp.]|jgi:hypothetical protein
MGTFTRKSSPGQLPTIVNAMAGKGMDDEDVRNFHDCDVAKTSFSTFELPMA